MDQVPDFYSENSRQGQYIAGHAICCSVAVIAVALRVVSRKIKGMDLAFDDYTMFLSLFFSLAIAAAQLTACHYGMGRHMGTISHEDLNSLFKAFLAGQLLWCAAIISIKISILSLYLKIFGFIKYFRFAAYSIGGFTILWGISSILVLALACRPIAHGWDPQVPGSCINRNLFYEFCATFNTITDVAILVVPMPAIWKMKSSVSRRLQVSSIFLVGLLTCSISIARLVSLYTLPAVDLTFPCIWSIAEPCLGILAACMATFQPLLYVALGKHKRSTVDSYSMNKQGTPAQFDSQDSYVRLQREAAVPPDLER